MCRYCYCQFQNGTSDCGLFALAFASVIAKGDDPSKYTFDQSAMRRHILSCIINKKFTDFPTRRIGRGITKHITTFKFKVHCKCRMPELPGDKMIQCNEWFHVGLCVNVPDKFLHQKSLPWYCDSCAN